MSILVTGAGGFIGSHLVRRLVGRGLPVSILTKSDTQLARIEDLLTRVQVVHGDMRNEASIVECIEKVKPTGIFHIAASNIQSGVTAADEDVVAVNVLGMAQLLRATRHLPYEFFINTGSFLEYGMKTVPMVESDRCEPMELYSVSKLAGTMLLQSEGRMRNKPTLSFRVFTPYGPFMQRGRLVEQVMRSAMAGESIRLTKPTVTRDFLFVADIVDLLIEGMEKATKLKGEIFNAGSGVATTLQTLTDEILAQTSSKSTVEWDAFPPVMYDAGICQADLRKTFAAFSWRPKHTLATGLQETLAWLRTS